MNKPRRKVGFFSWDVTLGLVYGKEIGGYKWWDGSRGTKVNGHVHSITKAAGLF